MMKYIYIVVVSIAVALWFYISSLYSTISAREQEITSLKDSVKFQNSRIADMNAELKRQLVEGKRLQDEARMLAAKNNQRAAQILKETPAVKDDDCASALILGNTK